MDGLSHNEVRGGLLSISCVFFVMPALLRVRRNIAIIHPFTGRQTVIQLEGRTLALTGVRKGGMLGLRKERQLKTICCKA